MYAIKFPFLWCSFNNHQLYIRSFQSKFANQYALSLPGHTYEDSVLVGFLGGLLQTVSNDCPYTTVVDIFRAMHQQYSNTRFGEGSAHMKVIRKYWEPFILQLLQCPGPRPSSSGKWAANDACRILVENYVTHSLWYAYWKHREHVKPFNDWKGARQALLQTTAGILEEYSWEKWDKMNAMRDRFLVHWSTIQGKLQDSATVSDKIKRVFTSSHITWKCALEAVQDIRLGQIPTARKSAAALVLAASIDTMHNRDYDSTPTSRFYEAVAQWVGQDGGEIGYFIDLCWPSWREHCRETGFCSSEGPAAFPKQIRMLNSLFSSAESIDEFRTTRRILEKFMDEDGFVVLSYDLSVEAAATTLIFDNNLLVDVPGVFRPMGVTENRFSLEPGIHLIADWVDGAIIISGIIVHFLLGMFPCITPH
jgi:hypothetical protein